MMKIAAIVGPSQSGKTRLMTSLISELKSRGLKIAAVKHSSHAFALDVEGKDSRLFTEAGADGVAVVNPAESAVFGKTADLADLMGFADKNFWNHDLVLIEGGKDFSGLMKIEVVPGGSSERTPIPPSELLAVVAEEKIVSEKPVFRGDQVRELADFLLAQLENATPRVALEIDGKDIGLNPFVQGFIESTVRGMLSSLKDIQPNPKRIALKLARRDDDGEL